MGDKDVDEQFAEIMAHWHEDARGLDPFGDPTDATGAADATGVADTGDALGASDPTATTASADPGHPGGVGDLAGPGARAVPAGAADDAGGPADPSVPPAADPTEVGVDDGPPPSAANPAPVLSPQRASALGWREHVPVAEPEDEHFVPPPPAPLPSSDDKHFWLMMGGLVGGPLLFLYLILFNRDGNGWWMVCGLAMTVAGFVLLVLRQPFERDEDDDGVRL